VIKGDVFPHKSNSLEQTFQNLSRWHNYGEIDSARCGLMTTAKDTRVVHITDHLEWTDG